MFYIKNIDYPLFCWKFILWEDIDRYLNNSFSLLLALSFVHKNQYWCKHFNPSTATILTKTVFCLPGFFHVTSKNWLSIWFICQPVFKILKWNIIPMFPGQWSGHVTWLSLQGIMGFLKITISHEISLSFLFVFLSQTLKGCSRSPEPDSSDSDEQQWASCQTLCKY